MCAHSKVTNLSGGCRIKRSQAIGRVEQCISEWVVEGHTIRDLNLAESISKRAEQSRLREELPLAEIHGIRFEAPQAQQARSREQTAMAWQANQFAVEAGR
jgi:hypothetical protein